MKKFLFTLVAVVTVAGFIILRAPAPASGQTDPDSSPIYGVKIPAGYRDWPLVSVARVGAT